MRFDAKTKFGEEPEGHWPGIARLSPAPCVVPGCRAPTASKGEKYGPILRKRFIEVTRAVNREGLKRPKKMSGPQADEWSYNAPRSWPGGFTSAEISSQIHFSNPTFPFVGKVHDG